MQISCLLEGCSTTWPVEPADDCRLCMDPFELHLEATDIEDGRCVGFCLATEYPCLEFEPIPEYCSEQCTAIAKNLDDAGAIGDTQRDRDR